MIVTEVTKLEDLSLRKTWMNDLAQAVAFLESLNLIHGDIRPENILLDRDQLKLSDFDWVAETGTAFEGGPPPYARLLNSNETGLGRTGGFGLSGPRTEQFALGSIYYLINYGFEVYEDRCLADDPKEHGPEMVTLLQKMEFPKLDGDTMIDSIIHSCWHNEYATVAQLASQTEKLLAGGTDRPAQLGSEMYDDNKKEEAGSGVAQSKQLNDDGRADNRQDHLAEDFSSKKALCQDLEKRGLLQLLSSDEPEALGFKFDWYRYAS